MALSKELVKILKERRIVTVSVVDARMVMVAHRDGEEDIDIVALS